MRRWSKYIVVGACTVLAFFTFRALTWKAYDSTIVDWDYPAIPTYTAPSKPADGRFQWSDLPTHYPVTSAIPLPAGRPRRLPKVQHAFLAESSQDEQTRKTRQTAVKDAFSRCWKSYEERAWLADELTPLSGSSRNTFGGWAATLVDSMDTLWIMDMKDEFHRAVQALHRIDFSTADGGSINVFETTIRYLGGFLSAYDLSGDRSLLDKAVEIAEMLYVAFDTPNRMPITRWDFESAMKNKPQVAPQWMLSAELGSLTLEFTRLSQLTGDPRWFDAVQRITLIFEAQQKSTKLPGMWPIAVDAKTPNLGMDNTFSLGAMADSLYEYFPKMYALLGGLDDMYEKLYKESTATAIEKLLFRPMTPDHADILVSGIYHPDASLSDRLDPQGQHLVCFVGGMFALGSRIFDIPFHLELAQKLVDGCVWTYKAFPSGMMPEVFFMLPCESKTLCNWDEKAWQDEVLRINEHIPGTEATEVIKQLALQPGFTKIQDRRYILRPEAIESVFILYRITGHRELLDTAWEMFTSIQNATKTPLANAALSDMTVLDGMPPQMDSMESFWMAETLKYFYLIFSDHNLISLDDYVFNTEAHPIKRPT